MELKDKVVLTDDDIKMVEDFFLHFNDPKSNNLELTDRLRSEIERFKDKSKPYTVEDQRRFSIALGGAICKSTHVLLRDKALEDIMKPCEDVWRDAQFYEEFEKTLSTHRPEEEG